MMYKPLSSLLPEPQNGKKKRNINNINNEFKETVVIPTFMIQREKHLLQKMISSSAEIISKRSEEPEDTDHEKDDPILQYQKNLLPLRLANPDYKCPLPTEDIIKESAVATKKVIEKLLGQSGPISSTAISSSATRLNNSKNFSHSIPNIFNDNRAKTTVKVIERHQDPLAPSTKKILKKIPLADDNTELLETPILQNDKGIGHKVSEKEKALLNIPSAVSSWENSKGFSVSIDKRLQYNQSDKKNAPKEINDKFVELTKALDATSEKKRIELAQRNERLLKVKEEQEEIERIKGKISEIKNFEQRQKETQRYSRYNQQNKEERPAQGDRREAIRAQRRKEIQHTSRFKNMSKKAPASTLEQRDMQIASGSLDEEGEKEVQYDSRFFTRAADASWKRSDDQMYDTPLFHQRNETASSIYRNRRSAQRTERGAENDVVNLRDTPVEFVGTEAKDETTLHLDREFHFPNKNKKRKPND